MIIVTFKKSRLSFRRFAGFFGDLKSAIEFAKSRESLEIIFNGKTIWTKKSGYHRDNIKFLINEHKSGRTEYHFERKAA